MYTKFATAIEQFNAGRFFECHDTLEDIWLDTPTPEKPFFQGLLHIAVGFYHFENENYKGARSQLEKAKRQLKRFLPKYRGVRLKELLDEMEPFLYAAQRETVSVQKVIFPSIIWEEEYFEHPPFVKKSR